MLKEEGEKNEVISGVLRTSKNSVHYDGYNFKTKKKNPPLEKTM